ncbi:MAG: AAA family ATPase [Oscillospiraceae bacterium]|nr:AAA family ATPase [Oscillospiraceae bacterium]
MRFCKLGATFGVLNRRTLAFAPGLNLIEASNESGKSTLCAFLRVMLYGLSTRERGTLADKNRYLPWSGAPMQGTLELETEDYGNITLRRDTARANSPMGRFAATHTGSGDEVPGLTAADCGEALLGVPREVYERSAFIRQTGLAIDPDAELERRIAALISTGEEGASYSEASAALKKQLNIRRSNARNGQIPALEREIESTETALRELRGLLTERTDAESAVAALTAQEADLRSALAAHDLADRQAQYRLREDARRDADSAAREARIFRRMLEDSRVPPREVLEENRSRLRTVDDLDRQRQEAERKQADAERALQDFDAGGKPPALRPVAFLWLIFLIVCVAVLPAALLLSLDLSAGVLYGSVVGVVIFAALFALEWMRGREKARLHAGERARLDAALRGAEAACAALKAQAEETMETVYAAIPAGDAVSAAAYVHENLARYDTLARMETDARGKKQRYEDFPAPDLKDVPAKPVERPAKTREALQDELDRVIARRVEARSRMDRTAGRLQSIGEAGELGAALAQKREQLAEAQAEYNAVALAMETLERANAVLQSRFSPELGHRAAEYFSALTGGRYGALTLDRAFHALATESGESVSRDAALLSRGAGDQLYLAVRLAICDMVLPEEKHVPLVLDDALINFDDARCHAALELLCKAAETRQVLLLTCQHREAAYLRGREHVNILSL